MSIYVNVIKSAVMFFPVLAAVLSLPMFVLEYYRHGSFTFKRALIVYALMFYMLAAYCMIILPLPPINVVAHLTTPRMQLVPFNIVRVFIADSGFSLSHPGTWVGALRSSAFLQPAFNLLLTLPFGFFMRYYFRISLKRTVLLSFCLSLFFELTQLSGLYFIYPRPYRLFDVDDLMTNTLGGVIGFLLTPTIARVLPNMTLLDTVSNQRSRTVGWGRRLVAWIVDYLIVVTAIRIVLELIVNLFGGATAMFGYNPFVNYMVPVALGVILIPVITNGSTIGKALVRIKITSNTAAPITKWRIALRQALIYFFTLPILSAWVRQTLNLMKNLHHITENNAIIWCLLTMFVLAFGVNALSVLISRQKHFFYDNLTHTIQINTWHSNTK